MAVHLVNAADVDDGGDHTAHLHQDHGWLATGAHKHGTPVDGQNQNMGETIGPFRFDFGRHGDIASDPGDKLEAGQRRTEDPWLYKDGMSARGLEVWLGTDRLTTPDSLDFDADEPGLRAPGVQFVIPEGDPTSIPGSHSSWWSRRKKGKHQALAMWSGGSEKGV